MHELTGMTVVQKNIAVQRKSIRRIVLVSEDEFYLPQKYKFKAE